jgi:LmbE family N-acetylglucosaminyl deacetylase
VELYYLSPHLDDAVLSCGGLIWEQVQRGNTVMVVTIFSGDPPSSGLSPFARELHARWGDDNQPYQTRREEDIRAVESLGATWRHLNYPDCIYRLNQFTHEPLVQNNEDLFSQHNTEERDLLSGVIETLTHILPANASVYCPLSVGMHLDHAFTRLAAESLNRELWYYADFPYAARSNVDFFDLIPKSSTSIRETITNEGLTAWKNAIVFYASQMSSFWPSVQAMEESLLSYRNSPQGTTFWRMER